MPLVPSVALVDHVLDKEVFVSLLNFKLKGILYGYTGRKTCRLNALEFVWFSSSVAVILKFVVVVFAGAVGVPVICPLALAKESPAGRDPVVTEYARVPPSGSAATIVIVGIDSPPTTLPKEPAAVENAGVPLYEIPFVSLAVSPFEFVIIIS